MNGTYTFVAKYPGFKSVEQSISVYNSNVVLTVPLSAFYCVTIDPNLKDGDLVVTCGTRSIRFPGDTLMVSHDDQLSVKVIPEYGCVNKKEGYFKIVSITNGSTSETSHVESEPLTGISHDIAISCEFQEISDPGKTIGRLGVKYSDYYHIFVELENGLL